MRPTSPTLRTAFPISVCCAWLSATAAEPPAAPDAERPRFTVFMEQGGWCWYQDPRAIVHDAKLFLGAVQGNGSGAARVGVYDLRRRKRLGRALMRDNFKRDDHNAPVLHARPDGRVLAMYALHGNNRSHYYRVSDAADPLRWSGERTYEHDYPRAGNVTYMNLHPMAGEGKLYNFFRGIDYNPSFITSTDHGETWGEPTHFIQSELEGRHRPYARYCGDGTNTVHVSFTDGHPDRFGNSVYHAAFRGGAFHRADGTRIKHLAKDGPLKPSEAERVFAGGGEWAPKGPASADRAAWTSSIAIDARGRPHIGYTLHLSNEDHRYRIASWNGERWIDREVAHAGHCLYATQTSYTGLITLDPGDPGTVVISTNVDPTTGGQRGQHEIHRARIGPADTVETIRWHALTTNSPVRNLRPVIARGGGYRVIAWLRGEYRSYTDYELDVVGIVEETE